MHAPAAPRKPGAWTLRYASPWLQWALLAIVTITSVWPLELIHLPAAVLLGSMGSAVLVASFEGKIGTPKWLFAIAQGLVGCLVARSVGQAGVLSTITGQWPIFLFGVCSVILFAAGLGALLSRLKILPGTTAIWGSSPGAATVMVLMSESFGGDIRLVAVMQYLRVVFVGIAASVVARLWTASGASASVAMDWFPAVAAASLLETLALAVLGAYVGVKSKMPAGALLVPMIAGVALSTSHVLEITLPPWLLAGCYALVGWSIGLRFTRDVVLYAARLLPRIAASIVTLIALCGGLAYVLHAVAGTDPLTAYLATSPGGADSVAIIASSSKVDVPFVMSMQIARMLFLMVVGPSLARLAVYWTTGRPGRLAES